MSQDSNPKVTSIIAYIGIIGVLIAMSINGDEKNKFVSFHVRQGLGLSLLCLIISLSLKDIGIPYFFWFYLIFMVSVKVFGIRAALNMKETLFPVIGSIFQKWFRFL